MHEPKSPSFGAIDTMDCLEQRIQKLPQELREIIYVFTFTECEHKRKIDRFYKPSSCLHVDRASRATIIPTSQGSRCEPVRLALRSLLFGIKALQKSTTVKEGVLYFGYRVDEDGALQWTNDVVKTAHKILRSAGVLIF